MSKLAVWVFAALYLFAVPAALATNWGAAKTSAATGDRSVFCTRLHYKSECAPEDSTAVYFYEDVTYPFTYSMLESEFHAARVGDFDSMSGIIAAMTTNSLAADVRVYEVTINANWPMAYTTCSQNPDEDYEDIRYYRWCDPQLLYIQDDPTAFEQCWNSTNCVRHFMCHEIGHTFGLQHTGRNSSCMEDTIDLNIDALDSEDQDHIRDCTDRPPEAGLPLFPNESRTAECRNTE